MYVHIYIVDALLYPMPVLRPLQRRHKKKLATRVVTLHDSDEDSLNDTGSGPATDTASSVPLRYEKRLQRIKDIAKQMPNGRSFSFYTLLNVVTIL